MTPPFRGISASTRPGAVQVRQPFAGIYLWRDPHGATYLVDHTGTRRTTPPATHEQRDFLNARTTQAHTPRPRAVEIHHTPIRLELDLDTAA